MDVLRGLMLVALVAWLVRVRAAGTRPVEQFLLWGLRNPFVAVIYVAFLASVWGFILEEYGFQALFFDDNPIVQFLNGAAVILLFLGMTFQHHLPRGGERGGADPDAGWLSSVESSARVVRGLNRLLPPGKAVQRGLANGYLEHLGGAELDEIVVASDTDLDRVPKARATRRDLARSRAGLARPAFRRMFSPLILAVHGLMSVLLLGVVPWWLLPALNSGGPVHPELVIRLPWMLGILTGYVVGVSLSCVTTRWLDEAAGPGAGAARFRRLGRATMAFAGRQRAGGPGRHSPHTLLTVFLVVHFAVTLLGGRYVRRALANTDRSFMGDWEALYRREGVGALVADLARSFPWLALDLLAVELAAAVLIRYWAWDRLLAVAGRVLGGLARLGLRAACLGWPAVGASAALVGAVVLGLTWRGADELDSPWTSGAIATAAALAFLCGWVFCLSTASKFAWPGTTAAWRTAEYRVLLGAGALVVAGLGLMFVGPPGWSAALGVPVFAVALAHEHRSGSWSRRGAAGVAGVLALLVLALATLCAAAVRSSSAPADAGVPLLPPVSGWLMVGLLASAGMALSPLRSGPRAPILYPAAGLATFGAFAVVCNGLDESARSSIPAAISLAMLAGLAASLFTVLRFAWPGRGHVAAALGFGGLALWSGCALLVAPNQFVLTYPKLAGDYDRPVYLNSEAYSRLTGSESARVVKLARSDKKKKKDVYLAAPASRRLATADFEVVADVTCGCLDLLVREGGEQLRARAGDRVRLVLPPLYLRVSAAAPDRARLTPTAPRDLELLRHAVSATLRPVADLVEGAPVDLVPATPGADAGGPARFRCDGGAFDLEADGQLAALTAPGCRGASVEATWEGQVVEVRDPPPPTGVDRSDAAGGPPGFRLRVHIDLLDPPAAPLTDATAERDAAALGRRVDGGFLMLAQPRRPLALRDLGRLDGGALLRDLRGRDAVPGDCVALTRWGRDLETPDTLAYLVREEAVVAADRERLSAFVLDPTNLWDRYWETPGGDRGVNPWSFSLEARDDGGLFVGLEEAGPPGLARARLYNGARLRADDRLILRWGASAGAPGRSCVARVATLAATGGDDRLPPVAALEAVVPNPLAVAGLGGLEAGTAGTWELLGPLENRAVLRAWKRAVGGGWPGGKPPLVLVTVSGGGIRASVWTAAVLAEVERRIGDGFPYHVRMVTGASGGMVGASYYVTTLLPPASAPAAGVPSPRAVPLGEVVASMADDQLDAVANTFVFTDVPGRLVPVMKPTDRGRMLEQTWGRLTRAAGRPFDASLRAYAADEALGWRPSLVFTPMMVEDGRRLLVSNLDLNFATRNVGAMILERPSKKIRDPASDAARDRSLNPGDDLYSLSAVEFYRLFPDAWEFPLSTAIRMSASFPWVSPAVSLPTVPQRRVVDAGYYDNYGVNLSALWLMENRRWLQANTCGVLVIQVRDGLSQDARTRLEFDLDEDEPTGFLGLIDRLSFDARRKMLAPGLQPLSTPLHGVSSARQWSMSFRNDEQLEMLDEAFADPERPDFFSTVVFECPVPASLSWRLGRDEERLLTSTFPAGALGPEVRDYYGVHSADDRLWREGWTDRRKPDSERRDRFGRQLRALGVKIDVTERPGRQVEDIYRGVMGNYKRLNMIESWWRSRREAPRPGRAASPNRPVR